MMHRTVLVGSSKCLSDDTLFVGGCLGCGNGFPRGRVNLKDDELADGGSRAFTQSG